MKSRRQADQADKYALYQAAVQDPEQESVFLSHIYEDALGRKPMALREDFCGTAAVCAAWVRSHPRRTAVGVDLDPEPLAWGRAHNLAPLRETERARVKLLQKDVRARSTERADVVSASNFSFYVLHTRADLLSYFRAAYRHLNDRGVLALEMMGGSHTMGGGMLEHRRCEGFRYTWEQHAYDPISGRCDFAIHFRFPDKSELHDAFTYPWRLWTIAEVRETLEDAGFSSSTIYWAEGEGEEGAYVRKERAPADPAWLAYVVGVKR